MSDQIQTVFEFSEVSYNYGRIRALRNVTLSVSSGLTCVLGPNGSGKSTLFGLGTGRLLPKSGSVSRGHEVLSRGTRRRWARHVGWTPQDVPVAPGLTVRQQVEYVAWLHGQSRRSCVSLADAAMEAVGLADLASRRVSALSGGQRRRVGIASGIVHRPVVAFLDEPTAGLDPAQRHRLREALRAAGDVTSIMVSTHQTEEVHDLYQRIVVLHQGRVAYDGPTQDFLTLAPEGTREAERTERAYLEVVGPVGEV